MEKVQKSRGRPSTRVAKFASQAVKMRKALAYLIKTRQIASMEDLASRLKIRRETLTNWATGQIEIDQLVKFTFSHLFQIDEAFWDAPLDTPVEAYLNPPRTAGVVPTPTGLVTSSDEPPAVALHPIRRTGVPDAELTPPSALMRPKTEQLRDSLGHLSRAGEQRLRKILREELREEIRKALTPARAEKEEKK